ncbi:LuxR C-terminal-related transcriptional regulator [Bradyrhizobium sp. LjRoot220]|uniref:LuxR C-terminal-related transcriptional regulator n=1 Tax=Bradyrhizobium sp. LjRoot220 TaxID=3342284 RepID=UPI003ECECA4F
MRRIRLVVADRRPIVLQGFASLFAAQTDFEVVASCLDGASCLKAVRNLTPDVVLVEDGFSDVTASEMLAIVNAENLPTRLVFFTASVARGDLAAAIAAGACSAISMRERPETLMQSLRLVAPPPHRPPAGTDENASVSENVLAVLTDQERKITLLVAQGLSNKAVARQLNVSPGTIKVHLNHIFQKLGINNRTALAALALSQRYGGIGALAALIFAAIDDDQAASASAVNAGHTVTDTFTVMAADGTAEVVTIIINGPKESAGASGTTPRAVIKARGAANGATGTSISTGKLVDFGGDITGSTFGWAAFNFARPSSASYGTFMMVAAAVWIYVIDTIYSAARALDLRDSLPDVFPSATASATKELVTVNIPGSADANFDGSDYSALLDPGIDDRPFALGTTRGDTVARGDYELQIFDADAGQDSANGNGNGNGNYPHGGSDNYPHGGSGSINALIDHGGLGETTATDASPDAEHGTIQASAGDDSNRGQSQRDFHADGDGSAAAQQDAKNDPPGHDSNHGQSQRDLHADGDGSAAAQQDAKNDPPGHDSNHGQSQRDLHASEDGSAAAQQDARNDPPGDDSNRGQSQRDLHAEGDGSAAAQQDARNDPPGHDSNHGQSQRDLHADGDGSAAARQDAKNDPPGHDSNHGQSQRDLHADEDGSAAAQQHAKHDATPENEANRGQSQRDLHAVPENAANNLHSGSSLNAGGKDQPADDAGQLETAAAPAFGDSFHFKKEMGASKASDVFELHVGHGPDSTEHGLHTVGRDGLAPIQEADLVCLSRAEQNAVDHAKGTERHLTHDFLV